MDDLSSKLLAERWVSKIDCHLREALEDVELIGELEITELAFRKICKALREQCTLNKHIKTDRLYPALFMVSLVFSGRYLHEEGRSFWEPYAEEVWGFPFSQSFRSTCSRYFHDVAKPDLIKEFGFDFPTVNDGDVVRSVYWHSVIPSYLQDDFSRWLNKRLETLRDLPTQHISAFIKSPTETKYMARTLIKFLVEDDTHDMAVELVNDLVAASDLLVSHDVEDIRQLFPTLFYRELWDSLVVELEQDTNLLQPSEKQARLEWVWSFEHEDWVLRLVNLNTKFSKKPSLCIWSSESSDKTFWSNYWQEDIWAEQQSNKRWHVREIMLGVLSNDNMLDAKIYIYDTDSQLIYEWQVPELPNNDFQFFRLTQQRKYAVPIDYEQITDGEWLVSHRDEFSLIDETNNFIEASASNYDISDVMRDRVGHSEINIYKFKLPIHIKTSTTQERLERSKRRYLNQPILSSTHKIDGTSQRLPPVYNSNKIQVIFSEITIPTKYLKIHLTIPNEQSYVSFDEYAEVTDDIYLINLERLIPADQIGSYELDITYGFRSRLSSPIEFSVLPNINITPPEADTIYHPLALPSVTVTLDKPYKIELPSNNPAIQEMNEHTFLITWANLQSSYCYLQIHDNNRIVAIEWKIERIFAWVDGNTIPNRLLPEDLETTKIHFRGFPNQHLPLYVDNQSYGVDLNARGEEVFNLKIDQFRDVLLEQSSSSIPIELQFETGLWLLSTFTKRPQIIGLETEHIVEKEQEWILLEIKLSTAWDAVFEVQICELETNSIIETKQVSQIEDVILIDGALRVGHYKIVVLANNEVLEQPKTNVLHIKAPELISLDIQYDNDSKVLKAFYEIDNLRLGEYRLLILDESRDVIFDDLINVSYSDFETEIALESTHSYSAMITWDEDSIGEEATFEIGLDSDLEEHKHSSTQTMRVVSSSSIKPHWIDRFINAEPELSPETLFLLATVSSNETEEYTINELARIWRAFARIAEVNRPKHWVSKYGLLPSWIILDRALAMRTNEGKSYLVYPEKSFLRGKSGIGKIALITPQEGKLYGYARWSFRTERTSRLHVAIPPEDPLNSRYSELDELDLQPAYYDRFSGNFHGARDRQMMPGLNKETKVYLLDTVHEFTLRVNVTMTDLNLYHSYKPQQSVDRRYTQIILHGQFRKVERLKTSRKLITDVQTYRYAVLEWINNYAEDDELHNKLKRLVSSKGVGKKINELSKKLPRLALITQSSLLIGATRFMREMEKQVTTANEVNLMSLDRNMILLAVILRSHSLKDGQLYEKLLHDANINRAELLGLLYDANLACPTLLEWALTWAEIFTVHTST